jgi:DNA-binding response OmpR family regulator
MNSQQQTMPSVLLLSDDLDLSECIRVFLEDSYRVTVCTGVGDNGFPIGNSLPDLLLVDLDTIGTGPYRQLLQVKAEYPPLKIVVMYMFLDEEDQHDKFVQQVADDYIFKPFSAVVLKRKLDQLFVAVAKKSVLVSE